MSDRQALIAERQKRIEELRKKKTEESQQMQQEQPKPAQMQQEENPLSQSPTKDSQQAPAQQSQQQDLYVLLLAQKRKKLSSCQVEIFNSNPAKPQQESITIEFGVQCDLEIQQQVQVEEEQPIEQKRRQSSLKKQLENQQSIQVEQAPKQEVDKRITPAEINSLIQSQQFTSFFQRTTKMVEKAILLPEVNILEDLISSQTVVQEQAKDIISLQAKFYDEAFANRVVTSLEWSPTLPNTFLASYSQNEDGSVTDKVGVCLLWNLQLKSRPEFYCYANSPITSTVFHPYSPNLIIGGLYNGQVVIWDLRSKSTPEKRTGQTQETHLLPIYGLSMIGSQNAHNLVSISSDGRLCMWNLNMFNQPQKTIDLKFKSKTAQPPTVNEINVTTLQFQPGDANTFYVGSEDGSIYKTKLHANQNDIMQQFDDHSAPITSLSANNSTSPILSNLLLSSSFDWTVKLWNTRKDTVTTFECSEDYVYDAAWNGVNPAMFSSVDGEGYVDIWDLSIDMEAPINRYKSGYNSINKQSWNKDGSKLVIGDAYGYLQVLSLNPKALKTDQERMNKLEQILK